jgi:hypothetical protein
MKRVGFILWGMLTLYCLNNYGQTVLFSEDFESGEIPLNWHEEFANGAINWRYEDGGYTLNPGIPYTRKPVSAHGGAYNALFQYQSSNNEATKLVTTRISALEFAVKPELRFYNAQLSWKHGEDYYNDYLRVYYKSSSASAWTLLQTYTEATTDWVERIILLPDDDLSGDYYLAFEGQTKWGWGTCVDDIQIVETGLLQKYLGDISVEQASEVSIGSGTTNNPILKINLKVMGNSGNFPLNSLILNSLNSSDNDIETGGVKLYLTQDDEFNTDHQIGTGVGFTGGQATFTGLNYNLPTGYSYLWVTYDIKLTAGHHNIVDAKLPVNSMNINGQNYFANEQSPAGTRTIFQTIHSDNFESGLNWNLSGEFEYGSPHGMGGSSGNPDPVSAYSGTFVIGTDLTGIGEYAGDYEKNLLTKQYSAVSDTLDFSYYNDLTLRYMRYLNIGINDEASIEVSPDGGKTWQEAWTNTSMVLDDSWKLHEVSIDNLAARKKKVLIRYSIGTTNDYWQLSGWNIDNFNVTGKYVSKDVGISRIVSPLHGCGHTSSESVSVMVKNYGATDSYGTIPLQYSFDGNKTITYDSLEQVIPFGDSILFTFKKKADLSVAGIYDFSVTTHMNDDEDDSNNGITASIYIQPTFHDNYTETFESRGGIWRTYPEPSANWEWGTPGFGIEPPSGNKLWMTKLLANYPDNDSTFVESGCYQNEDNIRKILLVKYWAITDSSKDGAAVQYSVDNGKNWQLVDTLISGWDWYNGSVEALNSRGWSGNSGGWITSRLILPFAATSTSSMKFRMAFGSNSEINDIGFAFDDFGIMKAPVDIGISQIDNFKDACQYINPDEVTVTIKNFGINRLEQNDTIIVGFDFNEEQTAIDTFALAEDLLPGETVKHTFNTPVNVAEPGIYHLTAYTMIEDDPYFYLGNNDTSSIDFEVYAVPVTGLYDTIQTHFPDTVVLETDYNIQYDYWWNSIIGANTYDVQHAGWYYLKVTDTRGNGCSTYDTTFVELLYNDVGIDSLIYPVDHCGLTKQEYLTVRIRNYGTDNIAAGNQIAVLYELNNGPVVSDTLTLESTLFTGHAVDFTFTKGPADLSGKGNYSFKIYTSFGGDTIKINDTIVQDIEILGRPSIDLGPDKTIQALSYTLDAGSGYSGYYWDNGATTQTREITETADYWVQVFDDNQCDNSDTVNIRLKIRDVSPGGLESPVSDCKYNASEVVSLRVLNSGTDTIPENTVIAVSYRLKDGPLVEGEVILASDLIPEAYVIHSFPGTVDLSESADYYFETSAVMAGDIEPGNDTLGLFVFRYDKPVIDFGLDEQEIVQDIDYQIDAGFYPYLSYNWQDGYSEHLYTVTESGDYSVIATDTRTSCYDGDTVKIILLYTDIGVIWSDLPTNGCSGNYENVKVRVKNLGTTGIGKDAPIYIACDVNGTRVTLDTLVRNTTFVANATMDLVLSGNIPVGEEGPNQIAFYTIYNGDMKYWDDSLDVVFNALPAPVVDFGDENGELQTGLPHLLDAGADQKAYLWQDESTSQTYLVSEAGIYSVTVTGQNDCQTTKTVRINMQSAVNDLDMGVKDIIIYPNPNNGIFNISIDTEEIKNFTIRIFNNQGQEVFIRQVNTYELENESIDVQSLPEGIYHITITSATDNYLGKMIIQ